MDNIEKEQIKFLRCKGYSYGKIAEILSLKRSTVSSYCKRNDVATLGIEELSTRADTEYRLCPFCRQLFLANIFKNQQFCTPECRRRYWGQIDQDAEELEEQESYLETLRKELDFLGEESDELVGEEKLVLCRKPINDS